MSVVEHPAKSEWLRRTAERLTNGFAAGCELVSDAALLEFVRQRRPDLTPEAAVEALRCLDPEGVDRAQKVANADDLAWLERLRTGRDD
jgi:hypothetical protein